MCCPLCNTLPFRKWQSILRLSVTTRRDPRIFLELFGKIDVIRISALFCDLTKGKRILVNIHKITGALNSKLGQKAHGRFTRSLLEPRLRIGTILPTKRYGLFVRKARNNSMISEPSARGFFNSVYTNTKNVLQIV